MKPSKARIALIERIADASYNIHRIAPSRSNEWALRGLLRKYGVTGFGDGSTYTCSTQRLRAFALDLERMELLVRRDCME